MYSYELMPKYIKYKINLNTFKYQSKQSHCIFRNSSNQFHHFFPEICGLVGWLSEMKGKYVYGSWGWNFWNRLHNRCILVKCKYCDGCLKSWCPRLPVNIRPSGSECKSGGCCIGRDPTQEWKSPSGNRGSASFLWQGTAVEEKERKLQLALHKIILH